MKKLLFLTAIILCIGICLSLTFCSTKSKLNDFKLVSYDVENNGILISSYSAFDEKGILKVFLKRYNDSAYYKYQLTKNEIESINKLSSKKLKDFIIKKKFEPGSGYSGSSNYLSFKIDNKNENLCFILPFMDNEFNESISLLESKIFSQNDSCKISGFNIDFEKVRREITKQEQIDNYLPKKQSLPPPIKKTN
ncbi:hypothetical protein EG346_02045 [Chryseobacterium carnipullorum]|uniref:Uncharacterized protein n=1 Tax=Chryseobacterium carnipullorum TaxID=1124835 RepID=A0A376EG16_CHRCU|nr:hypothetical protein [Chryseobacterium carnipullorum]AZA47052.1 hypothetical protein EG346_02045 [Chryseobacterium carnipullorum]AZA66399.1 hypothetical protein EG345_18145 [Chryseobacterium carnipullorum]STD07584.1 Uncharacterised protein [Chryseobacterium carnipullorum]